MIACFRSQCVTIPDETLRKTAPAVEISSGCPGSRIISVTKASCLQGDELRCGDTELTVGTRNFSRYERPWISISHPFSVHEECAVELKVHGEEGVVLNRYILFISLKLLLHI
jgi:hypothetical protein